MRCCPWMPRTWKKIARLHSAENMFLPEEVYPPHTSLWKWNFLNSFQFPALSPIWVRSIFFLSVSKQHFTNKLKLWILKCPPICHSCEPYISMFFTSWIVFRCEKKHKCHLFSVDMFTAGTVEWKLIVLPISGVHFTQGQHLRFMEIEHVGSSLTSWPEDKTNFDHRRFSSWRTQPGFPRKTTFWPLCPFQ